MEHGSRRMGLRAVTTALAVVAGCSLQEGIRRDAPVPRFEAGLAAETALLRDRRWDDGRAELAGYAVREPRYGVMRDAEAVLIVVKEEIDADALVKADGPPPRHRETVVKLNHVLTVPAGVYTYRQMATAFLTRADARPVKLVIGSQEWCGITSKILTVRARDALLRTFSYFGDEGERSTTVSIDDRTVLADALPLWVRTLDLADRSARRVRVVGEQLSNRTPPPEVRDAVVTIGERAPVTVPAGTFDAIPVRVAREERADVFWLAADAPHTLVRWQKRDGGEYALAWVTRAAYWDMNGPGDTLPGVTRAEPTPPPASDQGM